MIKRILVQAFPLFVAQLAVAGMAVTDTLVAGFSGVEQLAIVAVGSNLLLLGVMFVYGVSMVVASQAAYFSIAAPEKLPVLLWHGGLMGLGAGLVSATVLVVGTFYTVDVIFDHDLSLSSGVVKYIVYGLLSLPLAGIYFSMRFFWEGMGHVALTALLSVALFLVNIPLDWFFALYMEMGAAGCAVATSLSFLLATLAGFQVFKSHHALRKIASRISKVRTDLEVLGNLFKLALPAALALEAEVSLFMLMAVLIAPFGVVQLGAHQIAINLTSVLYVLPFALSMAMAIEMGRAYGSGNALSIRRLALSALGVAALSGLMLSLMTWWLRDLFPTFFTDDPAIVSTAAHLLLFAVAYQVADAMQMASAGLLRGMGRTRWVMGVTLVSYWVLGLGLGSLMAWVWELEAAGYWAGVLLALLTSAVLLVGRVIYLLRRRI